MNLTLIPVDRQARIQKLIKEKQIVKVAELSRLFGVTELTIRRDFDILEKRGVLERTHGGAVLRRRVKVESLYEEKNQQYYSEKEKIGIAAGKLVESGDTLLINTGSTNTQVLAQEETTDSPISIGADLMSRYVWGAYTTNLPGVQEMDLRTLYESTDSKLPL